MIKRKVKLCTSMFLLMFMSISLTVFTLHSHHNLELHNSGKLADTGNCLNADSTLCPICGHVLESYVPHIIEAQNIFIPLNMVRASDITSIPFRSSILVLGRSPPIAA